MKFTIYNSKRQHEYLLRLGKLNFGKDIKHPTATKENRTECHSVIKKSKLLLHLTT